MTLLDSFREMLPPLADAGEFPPEVEMRLPLACVRFLCRERLMPVAHTGGTLVATGPEETYPWLRLYEPWGCLFIRPLEEK